MSFEDLLLNGWDIHQWSVAIQRVGLGGTQMKYADRCQKEYMNKYGQNPLEFQLIGVKTEENYDLAAALFEQAESRLESTDSNPELDSSYGDQTKDDIEYEEAFANRWGR